MITQEARAAAWHIRDRAEYGPETRAAWMAGSFDKNPVIQAIAAAEQRGMERAAVICDEFVQTATKYDNSAPRIAGTALAQAIRNAKEAEDG